MSYEVIHLFSTILRYLEIELLDFSTENFISFYLV